MHGILDTQGRTFAYPHENLSESIFLDAKSIHGGVPMDQLILFQFTEVSPQEVIETVA